MDMTAIKQRLQQLSTREKAIAVMTAAVVIFLLPYLFVYSPSSRMLKAKKQSLSDILKETDSLQSALREQAEKVQPPSPFALPEADDLQKIFMSISRQTTHLGIDFISIVPEATTSKDRFIEMRLKIELKLRYRQLYDFMRYLGEGHRLFLVESLRFETNDAVYPSGIALIKAVTYLKKK